MSSRMKCVVYLVLGLAALVEVSALGAPQPATVEGDGTVEAISFSPVMIQMVTATNQRWVFKLAQTTELQVTGMASVEYLRPMMFIEFEADLDRRGKSSNPVTEVTIFTPSQQRFPGVFPAGMGGPDEAAGGAAPAAKKDPNATTRYKVLGRITAMKNESLTVNASRAVVRVDLAKDAKVKLDVADLSVVQKGDKIKASGSSVREGFADAKSVTIELAQPLGAAVEKKPGKKTGEKPSRKSRKDRDEKVDADNGEKPADAGENGGEEKPTKKTRKSRKVKEEPAEEDGKKEEKKEKDKEEAAGEKAASSLPADARTRQIVQRLQLGSEEAAARKPMKIAVEGDRAEVFSFSRPEPLAGIEALLGKPQRTETIDGMMAPPEGGDPQRVTLTLMVCSGIDVFVDQQGVVRFYRATR